MILYEIFLQSWYVLVESAPFLLFGYFVAGLMHSFVQPESIAKYLGKSTFGSVFWAALIGVPLPICSCGVVPAALALHKKGASPGATAAFFISTPETGVDSISVTYALMGKVMMIARPLSAFVTACVAGIGVNWLARTTMPAHVNAPLQEKPSCCAEKKPAVGNFWQKFIGGMRYAYVDLVADIAKWFLLGLLIAGTISALIPENFFEQYIGSGFLSLVVMLAIGIPMYVCATASTPIAAALLLKGLSPGAALVFLLAGPATNAASITVISKIFGARFVFIYLASIIVVSLAAGLLLNQLYAYFDWNILAQISHEHHHGHGTLQVASAVILLAMMLWHLTPKQHAPAF